MIMNRLRNDWAIKANEIHLAKRGSKMMFEPTMITLWLFNVAMDNHHSVI